MTTQNKQQNQAQFINLCQDLMFKIFFSKNEKLLLSLVQTFIFQPKGKVIKTVKVKNKVEDKDWIKEMEMVLKNPALYPKILGGKGIVLDMLATLNTGEVVNIEMQTTSHAYLRERILYYWSEIYGADFKSGENYGTLKPAYSLVFVNFPFLEEEPKLGSIAKGKAGCDSVPVDHKVGDRTVHSFSIRSDKPPHFVLTEHLGMIFVDLSRFQVLKGDSKDIVDMKSAWCYFIKRSSCLTKESWEVLFKQSEVFKMAESALKDLSGDGYARVLEKLSKKWMSDQVTDLEYATQKGIQQGREEGKAEGMQKGMQAVALVMLKKQADIAFISEVTGLSQEEIKKLKNRS